MPTLAQNDPIEIMKNALRALFVLAVGLPTAAFVSPHLDLVASHPKADEALSEAPVEVWLEFSVVPDANRTGFSLRGPEGSVQLGDIVAGERPEILRADVTGPMPAGEYTVSWVGAPEGDHPVRGRFGFTVSARR